MICYFLEEKKIFNRWRLGVGGVKTRLMRLTLVVNVECHVRTRADQTH